MDSEYDYDPVWKRFLELGFVVNLSSDSLSEADRLAELGVAPVVTVLVPGTPRHQKTPAGRQVIACPAQVMDTTCAKCKLCALPKRKAIVGFYAHGFRKNRVHLKLVGGIVGN